MTYDRQAHALVLKHVVGKDLGRRCDCDSLAIVELIQSALHMQLYVVQPCLKLYSVPSTSTAELGAAV